MDVYTHLQNLVNNKILGNTEQEWARARNPDSVLHHMIVWLLNLIKAEHWTMQGDHLVFPSAPSDPPSVKI